MLNYLAFPATQTRENQGRNAGCIIHRGFSAIAEIIRRNAGCGRVAFETRPRRFAYNFIRTGAMLDAAQHGLQQGVNPIHTLGTLPVAPEHGLFHGEANWQRAADLPEPGQLSRSIPASGPAACGSTRSYAIRAPPHHLPPSPIVPFPRSCRCRRF